MEVVKKFSENMIHKALLMALANMCLENDCTINYNDKSFNNTKECIRQKILKKEVNDD
ncbi:MAG: hypothetical protein PUD59_05570 [bacterium]|nr:hypothetical protein [bacterium]